MSVLALLLCYTLTNECLALLLCVTHLLMSVLAVLLCVTHLLMSRSALPVYVFNCNTANVFYIAKSWLLKIRICPNRVTGTSN